MVSDGWYSTFNPNFLPVIGWTTPITKTLVQRPSLAIK